MFHRLAPRLAAFRTLLFGMVLFLLLWPGAVAAQPTAEAVLTEAVERYDRQLKKVDDFVVEGEHMNTYVRRFEEGGTVAFRTVREPVDEVVGHTLPYRSMLLALPLENPYWLRSALAGQARHIGTDDLDGDRVHVLEVTTPDGWPATPVPDTLRLAVDAKTYELRRAAFAMPDGQRPVVTFSNYQKKKGVRYPFTLQVTMRNPEVTERKMAEAALAMERMEAQLSRMPEARRPAARQGMDPQFKALQAVIDSATLRVETRVLRLRVNDGVSKARFSSSNR